MKTATCWVHQRDIVTSSRKKPIACWGSPTEEMCIIIDANRLGAFLSHPADPDVAPIRSWLDRLGGRIVYSTGGAFARELGPRTRTRLQTYVRAGKALVVSADRFADDERGLSKRADLRSDDPHVLHWPDGAVYGFCTRVTQTSSRTSRTSGSSMVRGAGSIRARPTSAC